MKYEIEYSCVCDIGKCRKINQDNFICKEIYRDKSLQKINYPIKDSISPSERKILGVFDGMGGEECGEIASFIAAKCASSVELSNKADEDLLNFCMNANEQICNYATENNITSMGTTAAILGFVPKGIFLCNIGDSKIFRFSDRKLEQISKDHLGISMSGMKPPLSQSLGIPPSEFMIEPYVAQGSYIDQDIYLICSDGLTDMISKKRIQEILCEIPFEELTQYLLNEAMVKGGKDNITIITCKITRQQILQKLKTYLSG